MPSSDQSLAHGCSTLLRQDDVLLIGARLVGMAFDRRLKLVPALQPLRLCSERRSGHDRQARHCPD